MKFLKGYEMTKQDRSIQLEDFVAEALIQIINGVKIAQEHAKDHGAKINAKGIHRDNSGSLRLSRYDDSYGHWLQEIDFDIAVTAGESGNVKGGMGIFIPAAGVGYQANKDIENSIISRIKFSVVVSLPEQE